MALQNINTFFFLYTVVSATEMDQWLPTFAIPPHSFTSKLEMGDWRGRVKEILLGLTVNEFLSSSGAALEKGRPKALPSSTASYVRVPLAPT